MKVSHLLLLLFHSLLCLTFALVHQCRSSSSYEREVISWLEASNIHYTDVHEDKSPYRILGLTQSNYDEDDNSSAKLLYHVGLHVVPTPELNHSIPPNLCRQITDDESIPFKIIHLHEDVWYNKQDIVKSRIAAKVCNANSRCFARKTQLRRIDRPTALAFLHEHHLWGGTKSRFNYGLFAEDELVAVGTFSPRRHVQRGDVLDDKKKQQRPYRSHELIRYCAKRDGHVIGGITKIISGFCREMAPDDIVTCIDRDWGDGEGWQSIGFEKLSVMPPLPMVIDKQTGIRMYMVGAGIGSQKDDTKSSYNRPGISRDVFDQLSGTSNYEESFEIIASNNLALVHDAGVERCMLVVNRNSKLDFKAALRRNELGLEDLPRINIGATAVDLWKKSHTSFPREYYSTNSGINSILQFAAKTQRKSE